MTPTNTATTPTTTEGCCSCCYCCCEECSSSTPRCYGNERTVPQHLVEYDLTSAVVVGFPEQPQECVNCDRSFQQQTVTVMLPPQQQQHCMQSVSTRTRRLLLVTTAMMGIVSCSSSSTSTSNYYYYWSSVAVTAFQPSPIAAWHGSPRRNNNNSNNNQNTSSNNNCANALVNTIAKKNSRKTRQRTPSSSSSIAASTTIPSGSAGNSHSIRSGRSTIVEPVKSDTNDYNEGIRTSSSSSSLPFGSLASLASTSSQTTTKAWPAPWRNAAAATRPSSKALEDALESVRLADQTQPETKMSTAPESSSSMDAELEKAKLEWARTYCSVDGLRKSFGRNRNVVWGDLDAGTTRRLYKCLLPVALLDLYELSNTAATKKLTAANNRKSTSSSSGRSSNGEDSASSSFEAAIPNNNKGSSLLPQDLAPLAYRARVAAKLYARERSRVPARLAAAAFDGFRQWRTYGSFDCTGMSYDQVWNKYATLVSKETKGASPSASTTTASNAEQESDTERSTSMDDTSSITTKICLKIIERSCQSNEMIDKMVMRSDDEYTTRQRKRDWEQLQAVSAQLERDVRLLLQQVPSSSSSVSSFATPKQQQQNRAYTRPPRIVSSSSSSSYNTGRQSSTQKFRALRAVATVKRRMVALRRYLHHSDESNTHIDNRIGDQDLRP